LIGDRLAVFDPEFGRSCHKIDGGFERVVVLNQVCEPPGRRRVPAILTFVSPLRRAQIARFDAWIDEAAVELK